MFRLPHEARGDLDAGIDVDGYEHIEAGLAAGHGVIMALPHLGGWEYAGAWVSKVKGNRLTVVVEPVEPPELFDWFVRVRAAMGMEVVPLGPEAASVVPARAARQRTPRVGVRPRSPGRRCRGRLLRGEDHDARRSGHARAQGPGGRRSGRGVLPAAGRSSCRRAPTARHDAQGVGSRRRRTHHAGPRDRVRRPDLRGTAAVAPAATQLAQRHVASEAKRR